MMCFSANVNHGTKSRAYPGRKSFRDKQRILPQILYEKERHEYEKKENKAYLQDRFAIWRSV